MNTSHSKICLTCFKELSGNQTKFCSRSCHNKNGNARYQNYKLQQQRAMDRKLELIKMKGGKCEICGYSKNISSLCFHHTDPSQKSISLDGRSLSNHSMERILEEAEKCQLLCHNCHHELHWPGSTLENVPLSPLL